MRFSFSSFFDSLRDWIITRLRDYWREHCDDDTPAGETITVDNQSGLFSGGEGNDTITATHDENTAGYYLSRSPFYDPSEQFIEMGTWSASAGWQWDPETTPYPADRELEGLTALQGGAGDDSISATGVAIDIDGGSGNDTISARNDTDDGFTESHQIFLRGGDGNDSITVNGIDVLTRGGAGNDRITVSGTRMDVRSGDGNDTLTLSGRDMEIDGGEGADVIDVTGLTNSWIRMGGDDILIGRGDGADGLRFYVTPGADFSGTSSNDNIIADGGDSTINGGAGNDTLTVDGDTELSSTLIGGLGNDRLEGNERWDVHWAYEHFRYADMLGRSNDVLDGGAGNDIINFDLADTVYGGAGADRLTGFADIRQASLVRDFNPDEDELQIELDPAICTAADGSFSISDVSILWTGTEMLIQVDGQTVMRIESDEYLEVGFRIDSRVFGDYGDPGTFYYVNRNGHVVDPAALDVVVNRYEDYIG